MPSNNCHAVTLLLCINVIIYFSKLILTISTPFHYFFRYGITAKRFGYVLGMGIQRATSKNYRKSGQQHQMD